MLFLHRNSPPGAQCSRGAVVVAYHTLKTATPEDKDSRSKLWHIQDKIDKVMAESGGEKVFGPNDHFAREVVDSLRGTPSS